MKPIARKNDLEIKEDTGELFIRDLRNSKAICLNPTSAYVWQKCDGRKDTDEIAKEMQEELGVPVSEDLVSLALDRLSSARLLEFNPQFA
ncbi:MAG: PqqD family protein [Pyrinomonadaceae bacterium]